MCGLRNPELCQPGGVPLALCANAADDVQRPPAKIRNAAAALLQLIANPLCLPCRRTVWISESGATSYAAAAPELVDALWALQTVSATSSTNPFPGRRCSLPRPTTNYSSATVIMSCGYHSGPYGRSADVQPRRLPPSLTTSCPTARYARCPAIDRPRCPGPL